MMKKVQIEEINISTINELSMEIEKALKECKSTQIYITNHLFKRLVTDNKHKIVWNEAVIDSFHYCDNVEKAFLFHKYKDGEKQMLQMHFVGNNSDYMHLTYFATKGILYRHYLKGMKRILIINAD